MVKRLSLFFIVAFLSSSAFAQAPSPEDILSDRANALIDTAMKGLNLRAKIFNAELEKINALRPLDPDSFTPKRMDSVMAGLKDFTSYLEVYRTMSNATLRSLQDSVEAIRAIVPKSKRKTFLKEFVDAYTLDHNAFEKYTKNLSTLYIDVIKAMEYGKSINIEVKDGQLQFTNKQHYDEYSKIVETIEKNSKKVMTAGANAQKATADASLAMQKAYGSAKK
ncbi:MAG TPA: hypothetical protein VIX80_07355 [Candidatus Kapabacteria bacterium]